MGKSVIYVCPKCYPERIPPPKKKGIVTGVHCKDRGVCRPERCIIALDCKEAKR